MMKRYGEHKTVLRDYHRRQVAEDTVLDIFADDVPLYHIGRLDKMLRARCEVPVTVVWRYSDLERMRKHVSHVAQGTFSADVENDDYED